MWSHERMLELDSPKSFSVGYVPDRYSMARLDSLRVKETVRPISSPSLRHVLIACLKAPHDCLCA